MDTVCINVTVLADYHKQQWPVLTDDPLTVLTVMQEGHWSRDCPQSAGAHDQGPKGSRHYDSGPGSGRSSDVCYKCNQSV